MAPATDTDNDTREIAPDALIALRCLTPRGVGVVVERVAGAVVVRLADGDEGVFLLEHVAFTGPFR